MWLSILHGGMGLGIGLGLLLVVAAYAPRAFAEEPCQVAVYYFPGYHAEPRNDERLGPGWTEWNLIKAAEPRFEGHVQPKIPAWGYEDESQVPAMAKKIDAAADHGVTSFLFDWYWHEQGPFLNGGLDRGFLQAPNRDRLQFALMWANHDWLDIFPAKKDVEPKLLYPGAVNRATFDQITDFVIEHYFRQPNYWKVDGAPYYSIYELWTFAKGVGGNDAAREALDTFRAKTKAAGFPGLHLNAMAWGQLDNELVAALGMDSVTTYSWIHHAALPEQKTPYAAWARQSEALWPVFTAKWKVPYFPHVSMGWDNTPRYAWANIASDNTPEAFRQSLAHARDFLLKKQKGPRILTINAWNEWTEGSYLEPDTVHGMAYLEALKSVFPPAKTP